MATGLGGYILCRILGSFQAEANQRSGRRVRTSFIENGIGVVIYLCGTLRNHRCLVSLDGWSDLLVGSVVGGRAGGRRGTVDDVNGSHGWKRNKEQISMLASVDAAPCHGVLFGEATETTTEASSSAKLLYSLHNFDASP